MMAGMQGKDAPDMENLAESIKSEEQVKAPPGSTDQGHITYVVIVSCI